jgi:hypothetical protein
VRDLLILSPCFYPTAEPARLMLASARHYNLHAEIYGVGQPFIPHGADAQVVALYELMQAGKRAELVLVTDCRDVLFLAGELDIVQKFRAFRADLVMSTEQGCWPPDPDVVAHFHGRDPNGYDYVNAGQYIGRWEYVEHCLKHLIDRYRGGPGADNSQGWWMQARMRGELDYAMDHKCLLFQSMTGGADSHTEVLDTGNWKRLLNRVTRSLPCSVHFNGNPGNDLPQREMYQRIFG